VSHSGQDKHAWNEVQRHNRPADTGSLETRTLITLATMYSAMVSAAGSRLERHGVKHAWGSSVSSQACYVACVDRDLSAYLDASFYT
jgi:hypothetical protein